MLLSVLSRLVCGLYTFSKAHEILLLCIRDGREGFLQLLGDGLFLVGHGITSFLASCTYRPAGERGGREWKITKFRRCLGDSGWRISAGIDMWCKMVVVVPYTSDRKEVVPLSGIGETLISSLLNGVFPPSGPKSADHS